MKRLAFMSLVACAMSSTSVLAERLVPIDVQGVTIFVDSINFSATSVTDSQYSLTWNDWETGQTTNYKIERLTLDTDGTNDIATEQLPTKWKLIAETTSTSLVVDYDLTWFELGGLQSYRLSHCVNDVCEEISTLEHSLDQNEVQSLKPQNITASMTPNYESTPSAASSLTNTVQTGFSKLWGSQTKSGNVRVISNNATIEWDLVTSANQYMIAKTDWRDEYPTKSVVYSTAVQTGKRGSHVFTNLAGGDYLFEVYACHNDPNDSLRPLCGAPAYVSGVSTVDAKKDQMVQNLTFKEGGAVSDGEVSDSQSFELSWDDPTVTSFSESGVTWNLSHFEVQGEYNGRLTYMGTDIAAGTGPYQLARNLGTAEAPLLNPGKQYCYKVVPVYVNDSSQYKKGEKANPAPDKCMTVGTEGFLPAPTTFTDMALTRGNATGYFLSWSAVNGAAYYQIDRNFGGANWVPIYAGSALNTYQYFDHNINGVGLRISACTEDGVCGNYRRLYMQTDNIVFNFSTDHNKWLKCAYVNPLYDNAQQIEVNWCASDHPDIDRYVIRQSGVADAIVDMPASSYGKNVNGLVTHLVDGSGTDTQCYRVEAYYVNDSQAYTSYYQCAKQRPEQPTLTLNVINGVTGSIELNWNSISNVFRYEVQEHVCSSDCSNIKLGEWTRVTAVSSPDTSIQLDNKRGSQFAYRVAACDYNGCSHYSDKVIFTPTSASGNRVIRFIHTDNLGTPVVETDDKGEEI